MNPLVRWITRILIGLVALWLLGDLVYSRIVAIQLNAWESTVERDATGVERECEAYVVGSGSTALLFVHGINASPRCFDNLTTVLAERGFTCRAMRLPGFAQGIDDYGSYGHRHWIDAVDGELSALRDRHERVGIVGHSLGGAVTIGQLLDHPDSADFAILLAPAVAVSDRRSPVLSTRQWHEFGQRTLLFTRVTWSPFDLDCHDPAVRDYPGRSPCTPLSVVDELFDLMDANQGRAAAIRTPLLMVITDNDRVIDCQTAREFYEQCGSVEKQLLALDNSGHAIPLDYGWPRVAKAIAEFAIQAH